MTPYSPSVFRASATAIPTPILLAISNATDLAFDSHGSAAALSPVFAATSPLSIARTASAWLSASAQAWNSTDFCVQPEFSNLGTVTVSRFTQNVSAVCPWRRRLRRREMTRCVQRFGFCGAAVVPAG